MNKDDFIELTNKVYKQTLLFPKKEPLRYRIRETADDILENFIEWEVLHSPNPGSFSSKGISRKKDLIFEIEKDLELLRGYFNIIKWQNWVSYFDIIKIEDEYKKVESFIKIKIKSIDDSFVQEKAPIQNSGLTENKDVVVKEKQKKAVLDLRKEKILEILKNRKNIQVGEIKAIMPSVSKRTIRRDFDFLLKQGFVKRIGESNSTYYELI